MLSISISQTNPKRTCDIYSTLHANNSAFTASDLTMNGDSYANTPSPSSTASSNIVERSTKRSKNHALVKLRHRHDKLIQSTDSLTKHYIITTTNIIFQMQKQINKLKRKTSSLEQKLARQAQLSQPIIRIPRLTKDDLSIFSTKNTSASTDNITSFTPTIQEEETLNKEIEDSSSPLVAAFPKGKFCVRCQHEFSYRSGFLRHMRRIHKMKLIRSNANNHSETDTTVSTTEQLETDNGIEDNTPQLLVNPWDIGEGRLRPRRVSKSYSQSVAKVKCTICNKFFREAYIEKHIRRVHQTPKPSIPADDFAPSTSELPLDDEGDFNKLPSVPTVADKSINNTIVEFQDESTLQPIVLATTCLDTYQQDIVDEFLRKFAHRVRQTSNVEPDTTHLIANDDKKFLYTSLSLRLIEGIAHHCYCVSYRWLIDCLRYDRIIDEISYEIEGDDSGNHAYGGPKRSRLSDRQKPLFDKFCFMIKCTEKNDIHISNDRLQQLITTCGGVIITCVTQNDLDQYKVIVLCDRLYVSERRYNYDRCRSLEIQFLSSNWVLDSIFEYRLKPMDSYFEKPL